MGSPRSRSTRAGEQPDCGALGSFFESGTRLVGSYKEIVADLRAYLHRKVATVSSTSDGPNLLDVRRPGSLCRQLPEVVIFAVWT